MEEGGRNPVDVQNRGRGFEVEAEAREWTVLECDRRTELVERRDKRRRLSHQLGWRASLCGYYYVW